MLFEPSSPSHADNPIVRYVRLSLVVCRRRMPERFSKFHNKLYSPRQLMAILLLRVYLKATYRGVIRVLELSPELQEVLGLRSLPRHTTLAEFMKREVTPQLLCGLTAELATLLTESGVKPDEVAV